jgi:glycine/D-amino acid oxidase-like deaminating enzyme
VRARRNASAATGPYTGARRASAPDPALLASVADASTVPFWLDDLPPVDPSAPLVGTCDADLVVVGGGYSGLWTALLAKEANPSREVVLLEARTIGWAASGRNGGFCAASLTHGFRNGLERFPDELDLLERLGRENLDEIEATLLRYGVDAEFERTGDLSVAVEDWQVDGLRHEPEVAASHGLQLEFLDREQVQAEVASPLYLAGLADRGGVALVHPGKLARGLAQICLALGVRIHEHSLVLGVDPLGAGLAVRTAYGCVRAPKVALASGVHRSPLRRLRNYIVPVWDYVLVTEPLTPAQRASIGWRGRQGVGDASNQFHYYRLTADDRILWGGYDAIYRYGNGLGPDLAQRPETFLKLADHFFATFPQLEGVRFSHSWGGAIDTCSRFCAFWGTAHQGRLAYVAGYTGLGVGATRFGASVLLDLLDARPSLASSTSFVRSKPVPFPPEPFRWAAIELTRRSIDRADRDGGRRDIWLRTLDRLGLGFDS